MRFIAKAMKYCIQEVSLFNIDTESWSSVVMTQNKEPKARRNHVAGIINQHLVVFGGIDDR